MRPVIHLAGPAVSIYFKPNQKTTRVIQRCILCGEKLIEKKIGKGQRKHVSFWTVNDLVEIREDGKQISHLPPDNHCLPEDTCARLVEEEPDTLSEDEKAEILAEEINSESEDEEE